MKALCNSVFTLPINPDNQQGDLTSPLNVRTSDINDPFIVCLKEKSQYFYDSLVNENRTNYNNKFPFKKSTSVEQIPDLSSKLQYASDIVNSGSFQKSLKSPKRTDFTYFQQNSQQHHHKKPVVTTTNSYNNGGAKNKQYYSKKASGIVSSNPFEQEDIDEGEEDDALRFICESGILGSPVEIMGNAISGIFRKQSKVTTSFQEPVNKEQVGSIF